ncbi:MAG: UDP-N-acetylmuramoyl-tripeptide--D-alanyl-D-alanine ligase [Muribaculaceae bacterium]|nr:UDP-N-acetylmuramoyl-tripeptide--D-alanyl-D-alanine ligase [Roseburia sp.]MCM1431562.1 UDP-N-acetylmuramoyl-tripeptide--D-alanyl-D-alanine ligase [Muribaculaceae bacterium]MCM1492027.1 UDP-N-acetylmuramoyl-tripeptide--D-alanyl-D-alanine ligase [Muribaculaceae bacterium]
MMEREGKPCVQGEPLAGMTLENIAEACGGVYVGEASRLQDMVTSVVRDSRDVLPGSLFVAIVGARVDGHDYIPEVFARGALAVLSEKTLDDPAGPYIRVASSTEALKKLAAFYRRQLSIPVVGIIGSVGKTSTKEMVASVLAQKYKVLKTEKNYNNEIGVPLMIFRIKREHEAAVLELGISDFGEMHRLAEMARPDICVITNIGLCHLEQLKDRDGVLAAKTEVFEHMESGTVILNGDDDKLCTKTVVNGKPAVFYGIGAEAQLSGDGVRMAQKSVYATDIENLGLEGMRAVIHAPQGERAVHIPLPGEHNVYNALAGAAVGLALGLSLEEAAQGIASVQTLAGRSNLIEKDGVRIIDDCYNANPVSMRASIGVLAHEKGRRIAVLGDMGELGADERRLHRRVGEAVAESGIEVLFAAGELAGEYAAAAEGAHCEVHYYPDVEELLPELAAFVKSGDTVLVKASHFMNFARIVDILKKERNE